MKTNDYIKIRIFTYLKQRILQEQRGLNIKILVINRATKAFISSLIGHLNG